MSKQVDERGLAFSRRGFVAAGAAAAGAVVASGQVAGMQVANADEADAAQAAGYEVVNSDLLIIGAGFGAFNAAFAAISQGKRVTIIEKGTFLHGGNCGYNWDLIAGWLPDPNYMSIDLYSGNIVDQELNFKAMVEDEASATRQVEWINLGQTLLDRQDDGSLHWYSDYPMLKSVQGVSPA